MHRNVESVIAAADEKGLTIEPRPFPEGTKTAQDAAAALRTGTLPSTCRRQIDPGFPQFQE